MKEIIIFTDGGDTIFDEGSQIFSDDGIVQSADCIPGTKETLIKLSELGYSIALVADGNVESFHNLFNQHQLWPYFDAEIISETVGQTKPHPKMFEVAMNKMQLTDKDKTRVVMIGNNLERDITGANRFGITSIWYQWSPRYSHNPNNQEEVPDYTITSFDELVAVLEKIEGV